MDGGLEALLGGDVEGDEDDGECGCGGRNNIVDTDTDTDDATLLDSRLKM